MRQTLGSILILLILLPVLQGFEPSLSAQDAPLTPQELDQLLSPVALYPDSLLSQIMTASTNPQEILDVDNWLSQNPGLTGAALTDAAQQQGFDPAFIALVNFPQVLEMMAQHIDDYAAIGQAFSANQGAVTDSIQRLRAQAYAAGTLQSNAQQTVEVQQASGQTIYVIQPANPQVVYLPQYDPTVVYVRPSSGMVATPLIAFGAGPWGLVAGGGIGELGALTTTMWRGVDGRDPMVRRARGTARDIVARPTVPAIVPDIGREIVRECRNREH